MRYNSALRKANTYIGENGRYLLAQTDAGIFAIDPIGRIPESQFHDQRY